MILTINFPNDRDYTSFRYPGGEVQVRLSNVIFELVKHPKVEEIYVFAKITNGEIVELAQLINAIRGAFV